MNRKINEISKIITDKTSILNFNNTNYISTENMISNYGGVTNSSKLPSGNVTCFAESDILISNIRPYFKKIWFAKFYGGCSNDVIVLRANSNTIIDKYLYYSLTNDNFINYYIASCKGTKMPRGNKDALLNWNIYLPSISEQRHIVNIKWRENYD